MSINQPFDAARLADCPMYNGFRQRGHDMTRVEVLTDTAFAFAITMLVISINDIPRSWEQLGGSLKQLPALVACFMQIMLFWWGHVKWSRRFGLEDGPTVWMSGAIIFVTLVFVYLLRLMFSSAFAWFSNGWLPSEISIGSYSDLRYLFVIYGSGFFLLSGLLGALNAYALSLRDTLSLNALEIHDTVTEIHIYIGLAATALVSIFLALVFDGAYIASAGFIYATLGISMPIIGRRRDHSRERLLLPE